MGELVDANTEKIEKKSANSFTAEIRALNQYPLVAKYLEKVLSGNSIADFLLAQGLKRIALYAVTDFLRWFIADIERDGRLEIVTLGDKNFTKYQNGYKGYTVADKNILKGMLNTGEIDAIVLCSPLYEAEIIKELMVAGINQDDIYTVGSVIYFN